MTKRLRRDESEARCRSTRQRETGLKRHLPLGAAWAFRALSLFALLAAVFLPRAASAAPEAHILRIDPRASQVDGQPTLTTVLEIVQNKRLSDATGPCAMETGDAGFDCVADAMERPMALYSPFDFPEQNAILTVNVDSADVPAKFISKQRWGTSLNQPGVGTAWLILIDAASTMGPRFEEAKQVAQAFIQTMGPNDIVDVMFFNDRAVVSDSRWTADKNAAISHMATVTRTYPTQGRTRRLFTIVKTAVTDGFKELGNAGMKVKVPLHQALVVLSNGQAGGDPSSTGPGANLLREYLTKGRFPEENQALPKTPVPVISIFLPSKGQIDEFASNSREFMEQMANFEIGGYFSIVREGGASRGPRIVSAVRQRFDKMHIVKWQVSCVAPTVTQTFKLFFKNTDPPIAPDASFSNVPVGIDPTMWPLDIDRDATMREAEKNPIYPGGTVKVYGNFCWGGNKQRAELYLVPKNQPAPASLQGGSVDEAKNAQRTLIEAGLRGQATNASDTFVEFEIPDKTKFLSGSGEKMSARIVLYDNQAKRTSAVTADKILTVRAREAPPPYYLIAGITFGGLVLILLMVSIFRGGGRKGRAAAAPPPRPIVAGPAPMGPAPMGAAPMPMGGGGMGGGGMAPPVGHVGRATLSGAQGIFTVLPGMEMRAGRDGAACQILLSEPRVSGQHATMKIEGGQFFVRDDNSNNGTMINGQRLPPSIWSPVPNGAQLRFGPVEFAVRLE